MLVFFFCKVWNRTKLLFHAQATTILMHRQLYVPIHHLLLYEMQFIYFMQKHNPFSYPYLNIAV
jgi:hypothetical protein